MKVPFLDLAAHHASVRDEIMAAIAEVVDASAFAGGPYVARFEESYARFCSTRFALGVGHGTDAIWLPLLALGIGAGHEVIVPTMTFIATAEAVTYAGATPVFADIDPVSYTLDVTKLEALISPRTRAIIPVHLFGQCADMDPILEFATRHDLVVLEDGAQSQGAMDKGRPSGCMGTAGATSFYPGKNLGAWGEAGAITTNDPQLRDRMAMYRDHGQKQKYVHEVAGWNGRMDGIQAAVLQIKLRGLERANAARRAAATRYHSLLAGTTGLRLPVERPGAHHVFHIYAVRVPQRDAVLAEMARRGVSCGIHYPVPLHLQPAYRSIGSAEGSLPVSEACGREFLSLPMYPEIRDEQMVHVATQLREVLAGLV